MIDKTFINGNILYAYDMNMIVDAINKLDEQIGLLADTELVKISPSFTIKWQNIGSFEAGTTKQITYSITYTDGKYKYPLPNGTNMQCPINGYNVGLSDGQSRTTQTGTFDNITLTEKTNITASATARFGNSPVTPINNLGIESPGSKQLGQEKQLISASLQGYRMGCFYCTVKNTDFNANNLTSDIIRGLSGKTNKAYSSGTINMTVSSGATAILIACPSSKTGVTKVLNTTVNADMTSSFNKYNNIQVKGAGNDAGTTYNVWVYKPAEAYQNSANLSITLG